MFRKVKKILLLTSVIIGILISVGFVLSSPVSAQGANSLLWGGTESDVQNSLGLGNTDPRIMAANVIRVALGFLGILAVLIIIYAGWLWMSSNGDPEKIDKAKKILIGALIGLIIILMAFAIASFILNRLYEATNPVEPPGPVCDSPCDPLQYCCAPGVCQDIPCSFTSTSFIITSTSPEDEDDNVILNKKIRIVFNSSVDADTVQVNDSDISDIRVFDAGGARLEIDMDTLSISGRKIEFMTIGTCPDNDCGAERCLPANQDIVVEVENISDRRGNVLEGMIDPANPMGAGLSCGDGAMDACSFNFATGEIVDCDNPVVNIYFNNGQTCAIPDNELYADATDDSGISQIEFFADGESIIHVNNPVLNETDGSNPYFDTRTDPDGGPVVWDATGYDIGDRVSLMAVADDQDDHQGRDTASTIIRPAHCCNEEWDQEGDDDLEEGDLPELGVDCGGDCGACDGGACGISLADDCQVNGINCSENNYICASNFCECMGDATTCEGEDYEEGVESCCLCRSNPTIDWITPQGNFCNGDVDIFCTRDSDCEGLAVTGCNSDTPNGAVGNFVTIGGRNFGSVPGRVYFSDATGNQTIQAALANDPAQGNPACGDDVWSDNQIIVVVPPGAQDGPIMVVEGESGNDYFDIGQGDDLRFTVNTIERPGLCLVDPDHGVMGTANTYRGIRLNGVDAFFGNLRSNVRALNSNFASNLEGTASTPGLETGRTSTYVINSRTVNSNFLYYTKDREAEVGPYISYFDPVDGNVGQYVTIYGSGFGASRGFSEVFFRNGTDKFPADFDFPQVCLDSIWSDNQVLVKVPEGISAGDYEIVMDLENWGDGISTNGLDPSTFEVDLTADLKPSLCKMYPRRGPNNSPINLWGEYFGAAPGLVRFQLNRDQAGPVNETSGPIYYWDDDETDAIAQRIQVDIEGQAVSGPVRVVSADDLEGNSINLTVGECSQDADCDAGGVTGICCPSNSFSAGRCAIDGDDIDTDITIDDCYQNVTSAVYEWDFSTNVGIGDPCDGDEEEPDCQQDGTMCPENLDCDPTTCTCQQPCDIDPGDGACNPDDSECDPGYTCNPTTCFCETTADSCYGRSLITDNCNPYLCPNAPGNCSANDQPKDRGDCSTEYCNTKSGCSGDCSYEATINRCTNEESCSSPKEVLDAFGNAVNAYCAFDLMSGEGRWFINTSMSCPMGWANTGGRCRENSETCVLCDEGFSCYEDQCVVGGEVCPRGSECIDDVCVQDSSICECCCRIENSAQDCCAPLECEGNCGSDLDPENDTDTYGYCSGCALTADPDAACNCTGHEGQFCEINPEHPEGICRDCATLTDDSSTCSDHTTCCFEANGERCKGVREGGDRAFEDDIYYCGYYSCLSGAPHTCDAGSLSPYGDFATMEKCEDGCGAVGSCFDSRTGYCDVKCRTGFFCLGERQDAPGEACEDNVPAGSNPPACEAGNETCWCCCDPNSPYDYCQDMSENLSCYENKEPCDGDFRGLCCGCTDDAECAGGIAMGCGEDTCCHNRPSVIDSGMCDENDPQPCDEDDPGQGNGTICRNAIIRANFDQPMNANSFSFDNVKVVAYYGTQSCPPETAFIAMNGEEPGIWKRFYYKAKELIARILSPISETARAYTTPSNTMTYCSIPGIVKAYNNPNGVVEFWPNNLLDQDRLHYMIIRGDDDLGDSIDRGVLSKWRVSMDGPDDEHFNIIQFLNSKIWSFRTMSEQAANNGVCVINNVEIKPSSYLFKTTEDDPSDNDMDGDNFDTVKDGDKVFRVYAYSSDRQILVPIEDIYDWSWSWESDNTGIATVDAFADDASVSLVTANNRVTEGQTLINATAELELDNIVPSLQTEFTDNSPVYVFVCNNPWPQPGTDGTWDPWNDSSTNCTIGGTCSNFNYQFYYCRDAGRPGTYDDLPAILNDPVIRGLNGDIMKESFFFREDAPDAIDGLEVSSPAVNPGDMAIVSWNDDPSVEGFRIYLGTSSFNYNDYIEVYRDGWQVSEDTTSCHDTAGQVTCEITGLKQDTKYYFNLTSFTSAGAESDFLEEKFLLVADNEDPATPQNLQAEILEEGNQISLTWDDNTDDTVSYIVYYGTSPLLYGYSENIGGTTEVIINIQEPTGTYYVAVGAVDGSGNESAKGENELTITPSESGI